MTRRRSKGCLSICLSTPIRPRRRRSRSISTPPTTRCTGIKKAFLSRLLRHLLLSAALCVLGRHRVLDGEAVPAGEKLVSLFEPHADIIVKSGNLAAAKTRGVTDVAFHKKCGIHCRQSKARGSTAACA